MFRLFLTLFILSVTTVANAQEKVDYYIGHGIPLFPTNDASSAMGGIANWLKCRPVADGSGAQPKCTYDAGVGSAANGGIVSNENYDYKWGIQSQSEQLGYAIERSRSDASKVILMGHSMGGLRARAYLQDVDAWGAGLTYNRRKDVIGLVTIDTPHHGAPIMNNAGIWLGTLTGLYRVAYWGADWNVLDYVGGAMAVGETVTFVNGGGFAAYPGVKEDLKPGSDFLNGVNTLYNTRTSQTCQWVSQPVWVEGPLWERWETQWFYICDSVTNQVQVNTPISSSVNVMSIVGTQNRFTSFSFFNSPLIFGLNINNVLDGLGIYHLIHGSIIIATSGWWAWWNLPSGFSHLALGGHWLGRDWVWNGVTGGSEGDAIVSKDSQYMYQYGTRMGGNTNFPLTRVEANINHTGQSDVSEIMPKIRAYQVAARVKNIPETQELPR